MSKKVSVAIPTFNRVSYLRECLQSVLSQTFKDFDIFVFDNASEEKIEKELQKINDKRVHFIESEKNIGLAGNLNRILNYPFKSEYLIIFHDDDTMHPQLLEAEVNFLDTYPDAVFVVTDLQIGTDDSMLDFPEIGIKALNPLLYKNNGFMKAQMSWLKYGFPSAMYRVGAIGEIRIRPEFFHFLDMVFLAELSQKGLCAFLPFPLMIHRIHKGQYSSAGKDDYEKGAVKILKFFKNESDERMFHRYVVNFLLHTCAYLERGFFYTIDFFKKCQKQGFFRWRDFRNINARGIISIISILFGSRKIIDIARWIRNSFQL